MELVWIPISAFAALMQAVRTAAQKTLNQTMSTMGTTYVRSLAGLPFIVAFLAGLLVVDGGGVPRFSVPFFAYVASGALAQVLATALLIRMISLRSFAVGTMLTKTDILMTALIGSVLFSEQISHMGWLALFVVFTGVLLMLLGKFGTRALVAETETLDSVLFGKVTQFALGCAFLFTISYLSLREATLLLKPGAFLWTGTWTLLVAVGLQVFFLGLWLFLREPRVFKQLWPNRRIVSFIGLTSALGSIGWFAAFSLQNASYVRAVGQVESVFTVLISWAYFREKIAFTEFLGIVTMVVGVLIFRLAS